MSISEEARKAEASPFSGLALVEFPGSIQVEMDVPGAYDDAGKDDARWVVTKALRFSPPSLAVLIDGSRSEFQIHATVSNPTAKPIPLVVWQVQPRLFPTEEFEAIKNFTSFEGVSWNGTFTSKAVE